jgi:MFS superfamily sulfate permease-like transporter
MREGPEFVFWFIKWGTAVVAVVVAISVALFWLLKRSSDRQAAEHEKKAGAKRRP